MTVSSSSKDHATFWHLCCLLGRSTSAKDPKKDMNACTDILITVLKGHYIAAACSLLEIDDPEGKPKSLPALHKMSARERYSYIMDLSSKVLDKCGLVDAAILGEKVKETGDGVVDYARVFCHHASLALEYMDAVEHGDGHRIWRCWRILLLHFHSNGHTKYAWEALRLQFQLVTLPYPVAYHLKWGRFINTHGGQGRNISCDLHNEHLNKLFKDIVHNLGANLTEATVTRAARSVSTLYDIAYSFDKVTEVPITQSAHSTLDDAGDVKQVVSVVTKAKVFDVEKGRRHSKFKNISPNPLPKLDMEETVSWIHMKQQQMIKFKYAIGEGDLSDSEASDIESDCMSDIETEIISV